MGELTNCPKCGNLFVKSVSSFCNDCRKKEEEKFETVYQFIRKKQNRSAKVPEIAEATGVDEDTIMRFVKEGRLRTASFPNLGYPCERCGNQIQKGKMCDDCLHNIKSDLHTFDREKQRQEKPKPKGESHTYYAVSDKYKRK